ncbi:MAG: recombinase family protein, partial [Ruminococcus sp.]|uniref:recombinase family protein n=1 Tax=Ruminococcus sp. TaxID=41978 RepID=UPI0025DA6347
RTRCCDCQKKESDYMRAWLYYRLSRDEDTEMNSLQNQRQILADYAEQNGYDIVGESFDDNVSGMTFNRKGIGELETAVDEGKIDIVLVKDLSRLGRHRTQTALFIDHLRENNVKVYSVTEGIDSTNENDDMLIGFKQLFNDFYAKDISKKVRAGVRQKQKNAGLVETLPLGYLKDKNTGIISIDEETAWIVREVFRLYIDGYGLTTIAKKMNAEGIRSPDFYFNRKLGDHKPDISKKYLWVQTTVKRMLTNELYHGTLVNHKTVSSKIYKTITAVPDDEQYRHDNYCEPIIDETTWKQAQFMLEQRSKINPRSQCGRNIHRYAGIIKCAECGASLIARRRRWKDKEYVEYTCNSNHRYGKEYCTPHSVREEQLDELIKIEVVSLLEFIQDESVKYEKIVKDWLKKKPKFDREINTHTERIKQCRDEIEQLIIERINDREHAKVYNNMIEKREAEIQTIENKIANLRNYDEVCKKRRDELKNTSELIETILADGHISNVNMRMLVRQVTVHQNADKSIDVRFEMNGSFNNGSIIEIEPD